MSSDLKNTQHLLNKLVPFHRLLGLCVTAISPGYARLEITYRDDFIGDPRRPALHGGLISTLVDTAGGTAVWSLLETDDRVATVDLRVDYLRPGPTKDLACEAKVLRLGNSVGVADMSVFAIAEPSRVIATGKGVYNIHHPSSTPVD